MNKNPNHETLIKNSIESFWRTIPPLWHYMRGAAHRIAREKLDITFTQFHILRRIWHGKRSVSEISGCMHVSKPNISRAVEELVIGGLAKRTRDTDDRRVQYLTLTEKGQDLITSLHASNDGFMQDLLINIDDEELLTLTNVFKKLEKNLTESELKK